MMRRRDWRTSTRAARTVLNPSVPLFREARYLLAEDPAIGSLGLYHSVRAAIAAGETTSASPEHPGRRGIRRA